MSVEYDMKNPITLRELRNVVSRAPRLLERFICHRAGVPHPDDIELEPEPEDDSSTKPTVPDQRPWRGVTIPPGPPPEEPKR